jgi:urease accessory protein
MLYGIETDACGIQRAETVVLKPPNPGMKWPVLKDVTITQAGNNLPRSSLAIHDVSTWKAKLALAFVDRGNATTMVRHGQSGPLAVQRPFYPEGRKVCHVYLLHPPGGLVPGDTLALEIAVETGAHALLTMPAATKFYRSDGRIAQQIQHFHVADGAVLEWLPQETILFAGALARLYTRIDLSKSATFIGWDILCFGRPACAERFSNGSCGQHFELWRDGEPLVIDRIQFDHELLEATWGLAGFPVSATLIATAPTLSQSIAETLIDNLRTIGAPTNGHFSVTLLNGVLVGRYLGHRTDEARNIFGNAWQQIRPVLTGREACPPRVWFT